MDLRVRKMICYKLKTYCHKVMDLVAWEKISSKTKGLIWI